MGFNKQFNIESFLDLTGYDTETRVSRRKNSKINSQEFFTPYSIVKRMCDKVPESDWADPDKTFCEPCMGNGQFVLFILYRRIHEYNIPWRKALENMYALELMEDNVQETRQRVHELLRNLKSESNQMVADEICSSDANPMKNFDPTIADQIMDRNFVTHDFFTWNFEEWREMTEEEIKESKKKK